MNQKLNNTEKRFYDATIKQIDIETKQTVFVTPDGQEKSVPAAYDFWKKGQRGVLTISDVNFNFHAYVDQRLRRWPEQDYPGDETKGHGPFWSWKLDGCDDRISCKPHFLPGKDGNFIEDDTESFEIPVPPEFIALCTSRGLTPDEVLRGFIADMCGLKNFVVNPRADGFCSNGSDERDLAQQWFDRAYFPSSFTG